MKKKKNEMVFIGTRDQAWAVFFEGLAKASKEDSECEEWYESLANEYRKKVGNTSKRFKITISKVN